MSDLRTTYIDLTQGADLSVNALGLDEDDGLTTAVILSLFTDRRAEDDDRLPDGESDRRGWWGDVAPLLEGYQLGSRLWLIHREKQTAETLARAREYAEEALVWLVEQGAASRVSVEASAPRRGLLWLLITIERPGADERRWEIHWEAIANAI